jgi:GTP-binding protein HflX
MALIERSFREKIVLVGVILPGRTEDEVETHLDELAQLIDTAGADVVGRTVQRRSAPDPATYVGKGKAEEIKEISLAVDSDTVVFDDEL